MPLYLHTSAGGSAIAAAAFAPAPPPVPLLSFCQPTLAIFVSAQLTTRTLLGLGGLCPRRTELCLARPGRHHTASDKGFSVAEATGRWSENGGEGSGFWSEAGREEYCRCCSAHKTLHSKGEWVPYTSPFPAQVRRS